jgi:integrase
MGRVRTSYCRSVRTRNRKAPVGRLLDSSSLSATKQEGRGIEPFPKIDAGFRDVDLDPALALLLKNYIGGRQSGPLFETPSGLPLSARNIMRDSLHPILKAMGRGSAGFHIFRRFRESVLQMSAVRTLLIDYWMGHANGEMARRYGKQLLDNVRWRQDCAAKVGQVWTSF